jgi:hypothetical protein
VSEERLQAGRVSEDDPKIVRACVRACVCVCVCVNAIVARGYSVSMINTTIGISSQV